MARGQRGTDLSLERKKYTLCRRCVSRDSVRRKCRRGEKRENERLLFYGGGWIIRQSEKKGDRKEKKRSELLNILQLRYTY